MLSTRLALALLFASVAALPAQVNVWRPVGPEGGAIATIAPDPSSPGVVYAGTLEGTVWKTLDNGGSWALAGIIGAGLQALAVDPTNPTVLYAAAHPSGADRPYFYRSTDGGSTWNLRGDPGSNTSWITQLVAVGAGATVLLAVHDSKRHIEVFGVIRSTDGGSTWTSVPLGVRGFTGANLVQSPSGKLHAATSGGMFQSTDQGATWTGPAPLPLNYFVAVGFGGSSAPTLYATTFDHRVFRSTDDGGHWVERGVIDSELVPGPPTPLGGFAVDAVDPSRLYVMTYPPTPLLVSSDGGRSWRWVDDAPLGATLTSLRSVRSSAGSAGRLLVGAWGPGIFASDDGGESFEAASRGLRALSLGAFALSERPPATLYGGVGATVFRSADDGAHWTTTVLPPPTPVFPPVSLSLLEIDPHNPSIVWGASGLNLFKSVDAGATFTSVKGPTCLSTFDLAIAPSAPAVMYASGVDCTGAQGSECRFQKSTDGGASWSCELRDPLVGIARALAVDPLDEKRVYVADEGRRLVRTLDGAATWELVHQDLDVSSLAIDPLNPATVYAGTVDQGIWRSTDRGSSWLPLAGVDSGLPAARIDELAPHPVDPKILYASVAGKVFASRDRGESFAPVGERLPPWAAAELLAIDPRLPSVLYTSTRGLGVYRIQHEEASPCEPGERTLCLGDGRFQVQARWRDFKGRTGPGRAVSLTDDSGYFWFFSPDNLEVMVKALDGRALNDRHWVFYGALSNVEFQLVVTDTVTGEVNAYFNPERQFASRGDTAAFPRPPELAARSSAGSSAVAALGAGGGELSERAANGSGALSPRVDAGAACNTDAATLCLGDGRFAITIDWKDFRGRVGVGHPHALNGTTGWFWFFDEENVEIAIKILDGRSLNGHFWVFYGALSNVEYSIRVEDTVTGAVRNYVNPLHQFASRGDTVAFADP